METKTISVRVIRIPEWNIDENDFKFLCGLSLVDRCRVIRLMFPKLSLSQDMALAKEFDQTKP